jgi:hypothetical protein
MAITPTTHKDPITAYRLIPSNRAKITLINKVHIGEVANGVRKGFIRDVPFWFRLFSIP